eukprot:1657908-Prymnesium_polylepis.1
MHLGPLANAFGTSRKRKTECIRNGRHRQKGAHRTHNHSCASRAPKITCWSSGASAQRPRQD